MSYYNCCGIRPKHSNISKRVGEGVITICVVLDQSTVIFQKRGVLQWQIQRLQPPRRINQAQILTYAFQG